MKVVHCKKEQHDVYIGRPSKWGNMYTHLPESSDRRVFLRHVETREIAIEKFEEWARLRWKYMNDAFVEEYLKPIAGKVLGCWCAPKPCHGDVWIKLCREAGLIE